MLQNIEKTQKMWKKSENVEKIKNIAKVENCWKLVKKKMLLNNVYDKKAIYIAMYILILLIFLMNK